MTGRQAWLSAEVALPTQPGELEGEGFFRGFRCIAGLDEVGRGPLAGPVVAAAVVLPRKFLVSRFGLRVDSKLKTRNSKLEIRDSKLLTPKKREALAPWIKEHATAWAVGVVGPEEIDRINILRASLLAMAYAFKLLHPVPDYLLIDGPYKIPLEFLKDEVFPFQRPVKKGDRLCRSIAAASIVAKVARDEMMTEYGRLYPEYGFAEHKGYSSPRHLEALTRCGPSPIHRRSFKQVREYTNLAISDQQSAFSFQESRFGRRGWELTTDR